MGAADLTSLAASLIGRERELEVIDRLLEAARQGESGSLVVRGEPGIGKSALLDYAVEAADDMTVLRVAGFDPESDLAFASLFGLLRPVLDRLEDLVPTHSRALAGALGLEPSPGADRFLVSAAVLGLLAAASEERPVLCLVDDAQWLDLPSAEALSFAARRLRAEPIAILFAAREGEARRFDGRGLPELTLGGLDEPSARSMLGSVVGDAPSAVRERLLREAAGNPLALLELPAGLTDAQLAGREPLPEAIPLTPRLLEVFRQRIDRLPAPTQMALRVAAADNTGELATVLRGVFQLELAEDALDPAERAGLIRTDTGQLRFRHPLVRAAVYETAPLSERQRVHRALAGALAGDEHADRRVWHQAMASVAGDEEVASALEAAALRAQRRAGHASAATAFERAAELTLESSRLAPRLASAARAAWDAGQADRARALAARALPLAEDPGLRVALLHLRGVIEARSGNPRDGLRTLIAGADASHDPAWTLEILHEAVETAFDTGDHAAVRALGGRAARLPIGSVRDEFNQASVLAFAALFGGEYDRARELFEDALERSEQLDDARAQIWAACAASLGLDLGAGLPYATRAVELARSEGVLSLLPVALDQQAADLFRNSSFDLAYAAAEEGYRLSLDFGHGPGCHLETLARVEAVWGREAEAREHAEQVLELARQGGDASLLSIARAAIALLELTLGRPGRAADILLSVIADAPSDPIPIVLRAVILDVVEAVVRAGADKRVLDGPLERYRTWVAKSPSDARRALLAVGDALTGRRAPDEAFAEAIELSRALPPFQRARCELLYGEWLRRERRRTDARVHLRAASELFRSVGAGPWERRAEAELRATGERARKREPSTLDQLTAQELQIAGLVAEGHTNREIAAQLFISPRTVEYHLGKIFGKLAIASRSELIRRGPPRRDAALDQGS